MKRILVPVLLAVLTTAALAHEGHEHTKGSPITVTGEVVDMTCYMQHPASAVCADHVKCAKSCLAKGLPIGFLSTDGTLYTVIGPEHDPVSNQVMGYLGKRSTVNGTLMEQHGVKAIALTSIGAAAAGGGKAPKKADAQGAAAGKSVIYYTCEMDPDVHSTTPGTCPKCGMELVPEKKK